jgi:hypothetical protein
MPDTTPAPTTAQHTPRGPVISSCMVGNVSTVYWVNSTFFLRSFANSGGSTDVEVVQTQSTDRKDYQPKPVVLTGSDASIKSKTRDIAALSFLLSNPKDVIRVSKFSIYSALNNRLTAILSLDYTTLMNKDIWQSFAKTTPTLLLLLRL